MVISTVIVDHLELRNFDIKLVSMLNHLKNFKNYSKNKSESNFKSIFGYTNQIKQKVVNYKVLHYIDNYNFDMEYSLIKGHQKNSNHLIKKYISIPDFFSSDSSSPVRSHARSAPPCPLGLNSSVTTTSMSPNVFSSSFDWKIDSPLWPRYFLYDFFSFNTALICRIELISMMAGRWASPGCSYPKVCGFAPILWKKERENRVDQKHLTNFRRSRKIRPDLVGRIGSGIVWVQDWAVFHEGGRRCAS